MDAPLKKKSEPIEVKEKYEIGSKKSEEISGNATESNRVELFYNDEMKDLENMFVQYKNEIQEFDPFAISEKGNMIFYSFYCVFISP